MTKFQVKEILEDVSTTKYVYYVPLAVLWAEGNIGRRSTKRLREDRRLRDADQADTRPSKLARGLGVVAMQLYG
jgi:hypothetical protein